MTVIEQLRHEIERWSSGHSTPLRLLADAIFELSDQLRNQSEPADKPEPLITTPGRYRERGGGVARVTRKRDVNHYSWAGFNSVGNDATWESSGASHPLRESNNDLIAYIGPLEEETAGMSGFIDVSIHEFVSEKRALRLAAEGHAVIDLSTITKDQFVLPVKTDDYADMLRGRIVIKQIAKGGYEVTWAGNARPGERHVVVDLDAVRHLCPQAISQSDAAT